MGAVLGRLFSPGMSTPPFPAESKPSPWLTMAVPIVVSLLGLAVQWGTLGADVRHLERRATTTEAELAWVSTAQSSASAQLAKVDATLDAMNRELARLARAIEKLADSPRASR